jgi:hypothetical protein
MDNGLAVYLMPPMRFSWHTTDVNLEETAPDGTPDFSVWVFNYNGTLSMVLTVGDSPPTHDQMRKVLDRFGLPNVPVVEFGSESAPPFGAGADSEDIE